MKIERERGAMLRRYGKRFPPADNLSDYIDGSHATRHNTISVNHLEEEYAKEIFDHEQKEYDPEYNDISAGWRRQEIAGHINDIEYLLPYLKDPDGRVGVAILRKMPVKDNIDLYNDILKDKAYSDEVRIFVKTRLKRVKKSVRFILEK
jgi:hypothetical protein